MSEDTPTTKGQPPVHTIRVGSVKAAIWKNEKPREDGSIAVEYSVKFTRGYRDKHKVWHETTSYFADDISRLFLVGLKSFEYISLTRGSSPEPEKAEADTEDLPV
ncbi:MAG: hypothetical protein NTU53_23125 [Planctomycetota bacterium]|nr:hypothetical protein [Planctomycetota bacterium]